jgi:hypothetical protein
MGWIGLLILTVTCLLLVIYRLKVKTRRPTLRHALFASHLANRTLFRGVVLR